MYDVGQSDGLFEAEPLGGGAFLAGAQQEFLVALQRRLLGEESEHGEQVEAMCVRSVHHALPPSAARLRRN
ncbi:hypothetical protein AB0I99_05215 [Streptomyces spongiicola]|uniref:hypothetical protein n=1 Tax=Streptomyces spongiicola TaxID=1690221 RepID=UPI0033CBCD57